MNTDFFNKERKPTNQNSTTMARLDHPKRQRNTHSPKQLSPKNWEVSRTWHVTCMGTWPYMTSLRPNVYFITTKISKLLCVVCVQHLLCWTHSTCSLCTAHVLLILFVTTFTNYLTICLTVIFTYVVLVQTHNSQNIHKGELWTCDNNEITHHLRSK